ncbi:hypothetical protein M2169_003066 [Streptomyces sp. MJP52]|nr:hypothetical protein [Streptomyces sp. MJP52]
MSAAPAGRPGHLLHLFLDGGGHRRVADVGVDLHQETLADDHRLDLRVVHVGGQHRPSRRDLLAHDLGRDVLPEGDELHLGRDLTPPRIDELGGRAPLPAAARAPRFAREDRVQVAQSAARRGVADAVVLGPDRPARVLLGVTAGDDPVLPQGRQAPAHVRDGRRIGVRAGRVVQRHRTAVGEMDLTYWHADVGARALDVALVPTSRRACVLVGHETYSLRRHYPVTGSAVDAAVSDAMFPVKHRPPALDRADRKSASSQPGAPSSRVCKGDPTLASHRAR